MHSKVKVVGLALFAMLAISAFGMQNSASARTYYFGYKKNSTYNYRQDTTWLRGWNSKKYGCALVSIATGASYTSRRKVTPAAVATVAKKMGHNINGGFGGSAAKKIAARGGLRVKALHKNANDIAKYLNNGWTVLLHAHGSKPFSSGGHWIIAYGGQVKVNSKGKITAKEFCISDPGHKAYRGKCYSASALLRTMKSNIDVVAIKK